MIKLKNLIKESSTTKKKVVNEVNFDKIKLPSVVNRFLNKFVEAMKSANLNRIKRSAVLYKVIDASGMSPQQLMSDIQKVKKELQKEGGPGSGPHGNGEDNPFDREPSDDELANIEKEFEGKVNEALSLKDAESGIFDIINDFNNMVKKHPVAKKSGKIKAIMKQMYKLESQLGNLVGELE